MRRFILEEVLANRQLECFGIGEKTQMPAIQPVLYCPLDTLKTFQKVMKDSAILGSVFWNPYLHRFERFPKETAALNARHLQMLARNESCNVSGKMREDLYDGMMTREQIAIIRGLSKSLVSIGYGINSHTGGFNCPRVENAPGVERTCLTIDAAGDQYQELPFYNTGSRYFYPRKQDLESLGGEQYLQQQKDLYQAMEGKERPEENALKATFKATWTNKSTGKVIKGVIDSEGVIENFYRELQVNLELTNAMILSTAPGKQAEYEHFMTGMGAYSEGIAKNKMRPEAPVEMRLLRLEAFNRLLADYVATEKKLAGISALGLNRSAISSQNLDGDKASKILESIQKHVEKMGMEWLGAGENARKVAPNNYRSQPNSGEIACFVGTEGWKTDSPQSIFQSVDPMQFFNLHMEHQNIARNPGIRISYELSPEAFKAAQAAPEQEEIAWAEQYQWALESPDIRTFTLFFSEKMQKEVINPAELTNYIAVCLEKFKSELREESDAQKNTGLLTLLDILESYSQMLKQENSKDVLVDLIRKIHWITAIAEQKDLPATLSSYVNYKTLENNLSQTLKNYMRAIGANPQETEITHFCQEILHLPFIRFFKSQVDDLKQKLSTLSLVDGLPFLDTKQLDAMEVNEKNSKALMQLNEYAHKLRGLTDCYREVNVNLNNPGFNLVEACEKFEEQFRAVTSDPLSFVDQSIKDQILARSEALKSRFIDNCKARVLADFETPDIQDCFADVPGFSAFSEKIITLESLKVTASVAKLFDLVSETGEQTTFKLLWKSILDNSYASDTVKHKGDSRAQDPDSDILFMMEQLIARETWKIIDGSVSEAGSNQVFSETLKEIIRQYLMQENTILGRELAWLNYYLLEKLATTETFTAKDFAEDFDEMRGVTNRHPMILEIIKKVEKVIENAQKNNSSEILEKKIELEKQYKALSDMREHSKALLDHCQTFIANHEEICNQYKAVLKDDFFAWKHFDAAKKSLQGINEDIQPVNQAFEQIASLLQGSDLKMFEAEPEKYWDILKGITLQIEQVAQALATCSASVSDLHKKIKKLVVKGFDKTRIEQDIQYITQLEKDIAGAEAGMKVTKEVQSKAAVAQREAFAVLQQRIGINQELSSCDKEITFLRELQNAHNGDKNSYVTYTWEDKTNKVHIDDLNKKITKLQQRLKTINDQDKILPSIEEARDQVENRKAEKLNIDNSIHGKILREQSLLDALKKELAAAKSMAKNDGIFRENPLDSFWEAVEDQFEDAANPKLKTQLEIIKASCAHFSSYCLTGNLKNFIGLVNNWLFEVNTAPGAALAVVSPAAVTAITQLKMWFIQSQMSLVFGTMKSLEPSQQVWLYEIICHIRNLQQQAGKGFDLGMYKILQILKDNITSEGFRMDNFKKVIMTCLPSKNLNYDASVAENWDAVIEKAELIDTMLKNPEIKADQVFLVSEADLEKLFGWLPAENNNPEHEEDFSAFFDSPESPEFSELPEYSELAEFSKFSETAAFFENSVILPSQIPADSLQKQEKPALLPLPSHSADRDSDSKFRYSRVECNANGLAFYFTKPGSMEATYAAIRKGFENEKIADHLDAFIKCDEKNQCLIIGQSQDLTAESLGVFQKKNPKYLFLSCPTFKTRQIVTEALQLDMQNADYIAFDRNNTHISLKCDGWFASKMLKIDAEKLPDNQTFSRFIKEKLNIQHIVEVCDAAAKYLKQQEAKQIEEDSSLLDYFFTPKKSEKRAKMESEHDRLMRGIVNLRENETANPVDQLMRVLLGLDINVQMVIVNALLKTAGIKLTQKPSKETDKNPNASQPIKVLQKFIQALAKTLPAPAEEKPRLPPRKSASPSNAFFNFEEKICPAVSQKTWPESAQWQVHQLLAATITWSVLGFSEELVKKGNASAIRIDEKGDMQVYCIKSCLNSGKLYHLTKQLPQCKVKDSRLIIDGKTFDFCLSIPQNQLAFFLRNICGYNDGHIQECYPGSPEDLIISETKTLLIRNLGALDDGFQYRNTITVPGLGAFNVHPEVYHVWDAMLKKDIPGITKAMENFNKENKLFLLTATISFFEQLNTIVQLSTAVFALKNTLAQEAQTRHQPGK